MTLQASAGDGIADRLFDFALRGDADLLEEAAQAGVENVLVHDGLPLSGPVRMIQHVFAEVALAAVGAGVGIVALDVAVLAAGDVFRRADRDIVGAAEGVVVIAAGNGHGRLAPLEAAREQRGDEHERDQEPHGVKSHMPSPSLFQFRHCLGPVPDLIGDDPAIHHKQGNCSMAEVEYGPYSVIARSASDEAIHTFFVSRWIASLALAMTAFALIPCPSAPLRSPPAPWDPRWSRAW